MARASVASDGSPRLAKHTLKRPAIADEAVIITRGLDTFNHTAMDAFGGNYLVQTNYDPWLPDSRSDPRRTVALHTLQVGWLQPGPATVSTAPS